MKRRTAIRRLAFGALVTGLVPLSSSGGVGAAGAPDTPAGLCKANFGDQGPGGGPVVGEGPSGDPMGVTVGWEPQDWVDGVHEVVTCVGVDGRAAPELTTSTAAPPNSGTLNLNLTLPAGEPGALVCEQSLLIGLGSADSRHRTTSPVCFKLRTAEPEPPARSHGRASAGAPAAPQTPPATPAARAPKPSATPARPPAPPVAPAPVRAPERAPAPAPAPKAPAVPGPDSAAPYPSSTPPARVSFEAALGLVRPPVARPAVPAPAPTPVAPKAAPTQAETPRAAAAAGPQTTTLARTGIDHHIPLAGAGGLLAIGGLSILLGEPRRRTRPAGIR
ncbi:MAG: hypothetical protein LC792_00845 [Actinobacteria bacterium]|nr:hypothetical protein [Actinomycetota bacterium]